MPSERLFLWDEKPFLLRSGGKNAGAAKYLDVLLLPAEDLHARRHPLSRASIAFSNVRFLNEHPMRGASIAANRSKVRFLEHPIGGASIAANLSNVRFLEHPIGGASIASKLSNVRFLEHPMLGASIAANLSNIRFLEHPMRGASIAANLRNVRFAVGSLPSLDLRRCWKP